MYISSIKNKNEESKSVCDDSFTDAWSPEWVDYVLLWKRVEQW